VDWSQLTQTHKGQLSFYTWLVDDPDAHGHIFDVSNLNNSLLLVSWLVVVILSSLGMLDLPVKSFVKFTKQFYVTRHL
jgi:hypothetical protein